MSEQLPTSSILYLEALPLEYEEWTLHARAIVDFIETILDDATLDSYMSTAYERGRERSFRYTCGDMIVDANFGYRVGQKPSILHPSKKEIYSAHYTYLSSDAASRRPSYESHYEVAIHNGLFFGDHLDTVRSHETRQDIGELTEYDYRAIVHDLQAVVDNTRKINI